MSDLQYDADQIRKDEALKDYVAIELGVEIAKKNIELNGLLKKYAKLGLAQDNQDGSYTL